MSQNLRLQAKPYFFVSRHDPKSYRVSMHEPLFVSPGMSRKYIRVSRHEPLILSPGMSLKYEYTVAVSRTSLYPCIQT
jgi:hypothetical protein